MSEKEELEQRVDELEETVKSMLPSRRQALKSMGVAGATGLLGFSAGQASADASTSDADGNVGLPASRVDVYADGVDSNSVSTDKESITAGNGVLATYDDGGDVITENYSTIQAAVDAIEGLSTAQGEVFIPSYGPYSNVLIGDTKRNPNILRGCGIRTKIEGTGSSPALHIGSNASDFTVRDIWVDYTGSQSQPAIRVEPGEVEMENVDVDQTNGSYGITILGSRFTGRDIQFVQSGASTADISINGDYSDVSFISDSAPNRPGYLQSSFCNVEFIAYNCGSPFIIGNNNFRNVVRAIVDSSGGYGFRIEGSQNTVYADIYNSTSDDLVFANSATENLVIIRTDGSINIGSGNNDNVIYGTFESVSDSGARNVINGWGTNSGDPNSTGDWNGNGREGVMVRDTTNGNNYAYVNGGWVLL